MDGKPAQKHECSHLGDRFIMRVFPDQEDGKQKVKNDGKYGQQEVNKLGVRIIREEQRPPCQQVGKSSLGEEQLV